MATKRETPVKKAAKKKAVEQTNAAPFDSISAVSVDDDPEVRRGLVAMEAYYLAERRGFVAGHEVEDWIAAEAAVRARQSGDTA